MGTSTTSFIQMKYIRIRRGEMEGGEKREKVAVPDIFPALRTTMLVQ
jgi:hypothetical protein